MTTWHGYEQGDNAHPEFPWWTWVAEQSTHGTYLLSQVGRWLRGDGQKSERVAWTYQEGRGHETMMRVLADKAEEEICYIGQESPLPPPEPRCGQVWVNVTTGASHMITDVKDGIAWMGSGKLATWPPEDEFSDEVAVLVAGPGAPWADTSEVGDE